MLRFGASASDAERAALQSEDDEEQLVKSPGPPLPTIPETAAPIARTLGRFRAAVANGDENLVLRYVARGNYDVDEPTSAEDGARTALIVACALGNAAGAARLATAWSSVCTVTRSVPPHAPPCVDPVVYRPPCGHDVPDVPCAHAFEWAAAPERGRGPLLYSAPVGAPGAGAEAAPDEAALVVAEKPASKVPSARIRRGREMPRGTCSAGSCLPHTVPPLYSPQVLGAGWQNMLFTALTANGANVHAEVKKLGVVTGSSSEAEGLSPV